jgi:hypothetical protein
MSDPDAAMPGNGVDPSREQDEMRSTRRTQDKSGLARGSVREAGAVGRAGAEVRRVGSGCVREVSSADEAQASGALDRKEGGNSQEEGPALPPHLQPRDEPLQSRDAAPLEPLERPRVSGSGSDAEGGGEDSTAEVWERMQREIEEALAPADKAEFYRALQEQEELAGVQARGWGVDGDVK